MPIHHRLHPSIKFRQRFHPPVERLLILRFKPQRLITVSHTLLVLIQLEIGHCHVVVHRRFPRIGCNALLVVLDGFGVVAVAVVEVPRFLQAHRNTMYIENNSEEGGEGSEQYAHTLAQLQKPSLLVLLGSDEEAAVRLLARVVA